MTGANLTGVTGADLTNAITGPVMTEAELAFMSRPAKLSPVKLSPSYKAIPRDQIGFNLFGMEVKVFEYLKSSEGMDAIAFLYYSTYYLINKSTLTQLIDEKSVIKSIVYSDDNNPLMKVESIGIPLRFSYIPVSYIKYILKTSNKIEDRMFELVSTGKEIHFDDYDSSSGLLFKVKKIKHAGNIVLNTIRRAATAKKNKKGGRKSARRISKPKKIRK